MNQPVRFKSLYRKLTLWESLRWLIKYGEWKRYQREPVWNLPE